MKPQELANKVQRDLEKRKLEVKALIYNSKFEDRKKLDRLMDAITRSKDDIRRSQT